MRTIVHYLPIVTTGIAAVFATAVFRRWRVRGGAHLLWWAIGLAAYGAGTLAEAAVTLVGWRAPLAQGTVYLLLSRRTAHRLTAALLPVIALAATCVLLSPIDYAAVEPHRLTGQVLEWRWVRAFSLFINLYAFVFLVGGAVVSAARYSRQPGQHHRFTGNVLIAVGALLPGIGGGATRTT
jgi:hypothetical protein